MKQLIVLKLGRYTKNATEDFDGDAEEAVAEHTYATEDCEGNAGEALAENVDAKVNDDEDTEEG